VAANFTRGEPDAPGGADGGASTRISYAFEIRREFVDQQLDLVAVQVVVVHEVVTP
jgi:hypothetical protein